MQYNLALRSRIIRVAVPAIRLPRADARTLSTVGPRATPDPSHPTTGQTDLKGLRPGQSPNRNALYIGGGLVAIGAIWYYYAGMDNTRIGKKREGLEARKAGTEGGRGRSVEDAGRSVKGRAQEALKSGDAKYQDIKEEAQSKVQAARDQAGQGIERGKGRFEEAKDQAAHRAAETYSMAGKSFFFRTDCCIRLNVLTTLVITRAKSRCSEEHGTGMAGLGKVSNS